MGPPCVTTPSTKQKLFVIRGYVVVYMGLIHLVAKLFVNITMGTCSSIGSHNRGTTMTSVKPWKALLGSCAVRFSNAVSKRDENAFSQTRPHTQLLQSDVEEAIKE